MSNLYKMKDKCSRKKSNSYSKHNDQISKEGVGPHMPSQVSSSCLQLHSVRVSCASTTTTTRMQRLLAINVWRIAHRFLSRIDQTADLFLHISNACLTFHTLVRPYWASFPKWIPEVFIGCNCKTSGSINHQAASSCYYYFA